jgi:cytochrome P450
MTMLFAGHETTALALGWCWYLLSRHADVNEWLCAELDRTLGGRPPTAADLPRLSRTRQVVKEAMRLYPPVYAFGRDAIRDTTVGGNRVPAGRTLVVAPWVVHRDPRFYPEPLTFNPARWTPEFDRSLPRFAYLPFGGGSRICLGKEFAMLEAVLVLATLAQRFRAELTPNHRVELWPAFTLRSRFGLPMRIVHRRENGNAGNEP